MEITTGDRLHFGAFALGLEYTVRFGLKLTDEINGEMLLQAVEKTQLRYPYLSVTLHKNENDYYYENNPRPVVLHHTDERISLNTEESNYHIWSVSYNEDRIYLDISHLITDGTAMYMVLATLLYYYCSRRYGVTDHTGIRTLEDPILPDETVDPYDNAPILDLSKMPKPGTVPAFSLTDDGGMTVCEPLVWDIAIPEKDFVRFSFENNASPGSMVCVLMARAVDKLFPERTKDLTNSYIINARPMLGSITHHNCVQTVKYKFSDEVKRMSLPEQCKNHRTVTAAQASPEAVQKSVAISASRVRMFSQMAPTAEAKKQAYGKMINGGRFYFTYMVSYIGQWKHRMLSPYIREFWTHVPNANSMLTEIAAISDNIFLSVHQNFKEHSVVEAFLQELEDNGISYQVKGPAKADNAILPEPSADA